MEYYPRKLEEKLGRWIGRKEVILLKGPRQSGKTTLFMHLNERLKGNYVTLEDEDLLKTFETNPEEFAKRFLGKEKRFLFVDEAQYSKKAGKIIKLLYDLYSDKLKLLFTGSGSFDVKVEIGKYLVGRAAYFELYPLGFEEFLSWKAKDLYEVFLDYKKSVADFVLHGKEIKTKPAFEREFRSLLAEYLTYGGFPAIVKEEDVEMKKELLKNLVRTYLEKDVFFFFGIRHFEKFRGLLNYLSFNNGSILEVSSLMQNMKMDYKTAENYLTVLSNTYVISLIAPFYRSLTTELRKSKKIYFTDLGMRNAIINNFLPPESRTDKGSLLENFVLNELRSSFDVKVNYWRTAGKAEVDFVLSFDREIIPVEVKNQAKIEKSFLSFLKTYKPKRALFVTEKEFGTRTINGTKVSFIPHYFI